MKRALILLLLVVSTARADDDSGWSKPVNGLRGRLLILPPQKADSPFCRVNMRNAEPHSDPGMVFTASASAKLVMGNDGARYRLPVKLPPSSEIPSDESPTSFNCGATPFQCNSAPSAPPLRSKVIQSKSTLSPADKLIGTLRTIGISSKVHFSPLIVHMRSVQPWLVDVDWRRVARV
jgi:hypothetical protein